MKCKLSTYHITGKPFIQYCLNTEIHKAAITGNVIRMESRQNCGEKPIWRRRKWEDNAKLYFKKTGCEDGRLMALAREGGDVKP
jgi:hypothetical protein